MKKLLAKIRKLLRDRRTRQMLTRFVSVTAAIVVFITTYALVLPAITMEAEADCGIEAHQHTETCFEDVLICTLEESDGHTHDSSCYEKVLTCGKEVHIHSEACYRHEEEEEDPAEEYEAVETDPNEIGAFADTVVVEEYGEAYEEDPASGDDDDMDAGYDLEADAGSDAYEAYGEADPSASPDLPDAAGTGEAEDGSPDGEGGEGSGVIVTDEGSEASEASDASDADGADGTGTDGISDPAGAEGTDDAGTDDAEEAVEMSGAGLTDTDNDGAADSYVPVLDPIGIDPVLTKSTGIYYHAAEDGEVIENSAGLAPDQWERVSRTTELGENDLLRVYLAYTIPAGSLNATNPTARYRLPGNLHLTDAQVKAINETENGIAGQFINYDTLEILDAEQYHRYLGAEAVEGTRRPDQDVDDYLNDLARSGAEAAEYISAVVRVEDVYDTEGLYGEKGAYLGQDLVFTFTPYTVQKNQHEYDADGQPSKAGEKVSGWITLDFNMQQVDWSDPVVTAEEAEDGTTSVSRTERTAEIVFAEKDDQSGSEEIKAELTLVTETAGDASGAAAGDSADSETAEDGSAGSEDPEDAVTAGDEDDDQTGDPGEGQDEGRPEEENAENTENGGDAENTENPGQDPEQDPDASAAGPVMPAMSFTDSIRVSTGRPANTEEGGVGYAVDTAADSLPNRAKVTVRVEADEGTFPAGTTMVLSAVEDMDAVAESVREAVENDTAGNNTAENSASGDSTDKNDTEHTAGSGSSGGQRSENSSPKAYGFQAVDISFRDADGKEIEPAKPVRVALTSEVVEQVRKEIRESGNTSIADPVVVHVDDEGNAEKMDLVDPEEIEPAQGRTEEELLEEQEAQQQENAPEGLQEQEAQEENAQDEEQDPEAQEDNRDIPEDAEASSQDQSPAQDPEASAEENDTLTDDGTDRSEPTDSSAPAAGEPAADAEAVTGQTQGQTATKENATDETAADEATVFVETDAFSVYAIVYTVDFHWEVNGKTFEFSIPGGGYVSFTDLVEVLGIAKQDAADGESGRDLANEETSQNRTDEQAGQDVTGEDTSQNVTGGETGQNRTDGEAGQGSRAPLTLGDMIVSEETRNFVMDVESITFSSPELLSVSRAGENTTVGAIKDGLGLECEYSAELTEEQIAEINAQIVETGDWALISLKPFATEETLTVTMKDGDVFEIRVTDEAYDATQITSITNGGTYALVNRANGNALLSAAHSVSGRLQAVGVTFSGDQIVTTNGSPRLTKWTFTRVPNQTNQYYIQSPEGYLNMSTSGALSVSNNRQAFEIQTNTTNGRIKINRLTGNYSVNNVNNSAQDGYSGYNSNWNENPGEWFTLYEIGDPEETPPLGVTIHFVDREGRELTDISYSGMNPLVVDNEDGTFWIPFDWNGATGSVHLDTEFSKTDYTYANTHLAGERPEGTYTYDGFVIDAELKQKNHSLMFYTDCGWEGTTPRGNLRYDNLVEYDLNSSFTAPQQAVDVNTFVYRTEYTQANTDQDIYVILDPDPPAGLSPANGDGGGEDFDLTDPVYEKKLVSNGDGTYTLSLSITGRGKNIAEEPKANVVFIVDTSSSMQSNTVPDTGNTRLADTKAALKVFGNELLSTNLIPGKDSDTIEVAMVSFDGGYVNELDWSTDYRSLESKIDGLTVHTGTDWEDGLKEGYRIADAKRKAEPGETTYVVFFTDGEPSNYTNFNGQGSYPGGDGYRYWYSYFLSREASKDEFRAIVSSGLEMYTIFAYNNPASGYQPTGEKGAELLHNALKYGYNTDNSLADSRFFQVTQTSQLNDAFSKILNSILEYADIHGVELNDGITSLTSVGITSSGSGPDATYTAFKYTRTGGNGIEEEWEEAPPAVYDSTGVHWDLSDAGVLENGVTYKVSFVVWPSQEAYDWVADLNNNIKNWSDVEAAHLEDHFLRIPDNSMPGGYRYEVKTNPSSTNGTGQIINNQVTYTKTHSSIVNSLPENAVPGEPFEDPETHIVSIYTLNPDQLTYTKLTVLEEERAFGPPDINMGLSDTKFKLEKIWTVNRPEDLVAFLYNTSNGKPLDETSSIDFYIYQSSAEHPDQERMYRKITLGYDGTDFDWYGDTQVVHVGEFDYVVGTIWEEPLDIAFGLMLSPAKMSDRGLDSSDEKYVPIYASEDEIGSSPPIYYVLERGHDYRIDEPELDYRFDFNSDVYHPMLVDSHPRDAKIHYIERAGQRTVGVLESISPEGERLDALTAENILRGQLTLRKLVQDVEGNPDSSDYAHSKVFPLTVELYNEDAPFHDDPDNPSQQNVPWYGIQINGTGEVFYYYTIEDGVVRYVNEAEACVDGDYLHGLKPGYHGNIMTGSNDYKRATATIEVSPRDIWTITNIPGGTQYTVTEGTLTNGYTFVKAEELTVVDDGETVSRVPVTTVEDTPQITGEIHSNHTTEVEFTNRKLIVPLDIELIKIDVKDLDDVDEVESLSQLTTLTGAAFTLEKYTDSSFRQLDTEWETGGKAVLADEDEDGRFSVEALPEGFYKIVETRFPDGYVKSESDPIFEVRRDENGDLQLILLKNDPEEGIQDAGDNESSTVKIRNLSIVAGNTPGAVLPNAGGPGTRLLDLLGILLVGLAGAALLIKRTCFRPARPAGEK